MNNENNISVNLNNLSDEERQTLISLIEKANKPKSKVWKPEKNETFFFIDWNCGTQYLQWSDDCDENLSAPYAPAPCPSPWKYNEDCEFCSESTICKYINNKNNKEDN